MSLQGLNARLHDARRGAVILAIGALAAIPACQGHDLGTRCALDRPPFDDGQTTWIVGEQPLIGEEQLLQDGTCESFVCLNHEGIAPYCSRPCSKNLPCPTGFECKLVQSLGPRADDSYCVFAACETVTDCKDIKTFQCIEFPATGLDSTQTFKRCQLIATEQ